jgi:WD40 repeat protein
MAHPAAVASVAFSPDGQRLATATVNGKARLWDAASGEPLVPSFDIGNVSSLRFTPDGATLISASADRTACWDVSPPPLLAPAVVALQAQVHSGMALSGGEAAHTLAPLTAAQWRERVRQLQGVSP